jgi:spore coat protein CotH
MLRSSLLVFTALAASFLQACSCGTPGIGPLETGDTAAPEGPDESEWVYDPDHLLRVEIELDPGDWDELRRQSRDAWEMLGHADCLAEPWGSPFTYFPATVSIDGELFDNVGVRKKGFLGSLSEDKPALKIDLSEYGEPALYSGVDRLTLNNSISDPSFLRQCLGYGFYRDAGMPASRCNYATVAVNGVELGVFVNVEPIKKPLLRRFFDDDEGNLYEGTLSDFREGWDGTFEKKTNEDEGDYGDIQAMTAALELPDDELLEALEPLVNLDAFYTHWAAEVLSSHTDGYAWNTNNYYLYADPGDAGRFHFIPWGIDALLYGESGEGMPASVFAYGQLANRLFEHEQGREAYRQRLVDLLEGPWDEEVFEARMDRDQALLLPELPADQVDFVLESQESLRRRMNLRRDEVNAALAADEGWDWGQRDSWCFEVIGSLEASFDTDYQSIYHQDAFTYGVAELSFALGGDLFEPAEVGSVAGESHGSAVLYVAAWISEHEAVIAYFSTPEETLVPGTLEVGWGESAAALYYIDVWTMEDFAFVSYIVGTVQLEEAGTDTGDTVVGSMAGELMSWG